MERWSETAWELECAHLQEGTLAPPECAASNVRVSLDLALRRISVSIGFVLCGFDHQTDGPAEVCTPAIHNLAEWPMIVGAPHM